MPSPRTSWEDLSNLGWHKQRIYNKLNELRGHSMHGLDDMTLNERISETYGWYCYNTVKGQPRIESHVPGVIKSSTILWAYDNTENNKPFGPADWTETWRTSKSASLSITYRASMTMSENISIPEVGGSDFSMTIDLDTNATVSKEKTHDLTGNWKITVDAGEKVFIERVRTVQTGRTVYLLDYGISDNSYIGTKGDKYNDHYYWAYKVNDILDKPTGTITLSGESSDEGFVFKIVRKKGGVTHSEILPIEGEDTVYPSMIPGPE